MDVILRNNAKNIRQGTRKQRGNLNEKTTKLYIYNQKERARIYNEERGIGELNTQMTC